MKNSLQDQLLKAGLIDKKKAKTLEKEQRKMKKQQPKGHAVENEVKEKAKQAAIEKAERDRKLNQEKNKAAEDKALQAQIKQLIEVNQIKSLAKGDDGIAYQFTDNKTIKKLIVDAVQHKQLVNGVLTIVKNNNSYAMVPRIVAEKIEKRDSNVVIVINKDISEEDDDDPYAEYKIPDDLMW
ncbi:MAG: DUF2058 domain-containing protein [Cellvibrionaceae bacterium]